MTKSNAPLIRTVKAAALGAVIGFLFFRKGHIPLAIETMFRISIPMRVAALLLFVFSVYWSIAARNSAPTKSAESIWSRQLHLILVNGAILLLLFSVPVLTRRFLPANHVIEIAGLIIEAAFFLLAVWARVYLGSNWSGEVRIAAEHQLIRSGPYKLVRHPIYTGVLGAYFGIALVSGEIHAPIALVIVLLAYWRKIRLEEQVLSQTFGADFDNYRRGTWALVPLLY
jgi:protein-S-isoprenylcysteine O-methyltransferase Ste14